MADYALFIEADTNYGAVEASGAVFAFTEIGLSATGIEGFEVYVDDVFVMGG
jgi:hypothetical protein